jgi:hypothetical protein
VASEERTPDDISPKTDDRPRSRGGPEMTRKASQAATQAESERRARVDTEILIAVDGLNSAVQSLASTFEFENQRAFERIHHIEARLCGFERFANRLGKVLDQIEADRDAENWWREGESCGGDVGGPPA